LSSSVIYMRRVLPIGYSLRVGSGGAHSARDNNAHAVDHELHRQRREQHAEQA